MQSVTEITKHNNHTYFSCYYHLFSPRNTYTIVLILGLGGCLVTTNLLRHAHVSETLDRNLMAENGAIVEMLMFKTHANEIPFK